MARSRFVRPETTTLTLLSGDTLTVKKRLTQGERRETFHRSTVIREGKDRVDGLLYQRSTVAVYLLDWTLPEFPIAGKSLGEIESALDDLEPEAFREILDAIDAHVAAMEAERAAEKNAPGDASKSPAISPSPVGSAGATSGSVN